MGETFRGSSRRGSGRGMVRAAAALPGALLFDCDGVLVDTEKDGHRISFNDTFAEVGCVSDFLPLLFLVI